MVKVLLAEDNRVNQIVASKMLESLGCAVEIASDGNEAVAKVQSGEFDIIFMDCQMPEKDGYTATGEIVALAEQGKLKKTPIIALTAHAMSGDREKCLNAGIDDFLTKPVSESDLQTVISRWVEEGRQADSSGDNQQAAKARLLDIDSFNKLRELMEDNFVNMLNAYFKTVDEQEKKIQNGIESENFGMIMNAAHTLKSPSAQIGAKILSAKADEVEELARADDIAHLEEIKARFSELQALLRDSNEEIRALAKS